MRLGARPAASSLPRARRAALGVGGCLLTVAVCVTATRWAPGHGLDRTLLDALPAPSRDGVGTDVALWATHASDLSRAAGLSAAVVAGAWLAGSRRRALAAGVVLLGATATTQALQPLFTEPRFYSLAGETFVRADPSPSGHATFSASLVLALTLVTPRRTWPALGAFAALYGVGIVAVVLAVRTHFPSDVLAGWAMATAWWIAARAWLAHPGSEPSPRQPFALALAAVALVVGLAAQGTWIPGQLLHDAPTRTTVALGSIGLLLAGAAAGYALQRRAGSVAQSRVSSA